MSTTEKVLFLILHLTLAVFGDTRVGIGESCLSNSDCTTPNTICDIDQNNVGQLICSCDLEYTPDSTGAICLAKELGQDCSNDNQCQSLVGAICQDSEDGTEKVCSCGLGYTPDSTGTICLAKELGQKCSINEQCQSLAGAVCQDSEDGTVKVCSCDLEYTPDTTGTICLAKELGQECSINEQCESLAGATCQDPEDGTAKVCSCDPLYTPDSTGTICLAKELGQKCSINEQCQSLAGAVCQENGTVSVCNCVSGYFSNHEQTLCLLYPTLLKEQCNSGEQCKLVDQFADCSIVDPVVNSVGICECDVRYVENDSKDTCWARAVHDPCIKNGTCEFLGNTSYCFTHPGVPSICDCLPPSVPSPGMNKCWTYATEVGNYCEEYLQCERLGDANEVQCVPNDDTSGPDSCQCNENTAIASGNNDKCLPYIRDHGTNCAESQQCSKDHMVCRTEQGSDQQTKCLCDDEYTYVSSPAECFNVIHHVGVTANCSYNEQCTSGLGPQSSCSSSGTCTCNPGAKYLESKQRCYTALSLNDGCLESEQCEVGINDLALCSPTTSKCVCKSGMILWRESCYAKKLIGDTCTSLEQCTVPIKGGVLCDPIEKKCSCDIGYFADFANTICTAGAFRVNNLPILTLAYTLMFVMNKIIF